MDDQSTPPISEDTNLNDTTNQVSHPIAQPVKKPVIEEPGIEESIMTHDTPSEDSSAEEESFMNYDPQE